VAENITCALYHTISLTGTCKAMRRDLRPVRWVNWIVGVRQTDSRSRRYVMGQLHSALFTWFPRRRSGQGTTDTLPLSVRTLSWINSSPNILFFSVLPSLWSSGWSSWLQNGDVLCFLWGTNWIQICYVEKSRPPLWSSGQSFRLQNGDVLCFLWGIN
jgi:hypothetical protein